MEPIFIVLSCATVIMCVVSGARWYFYTKNNREKAILGKISNGYDLSDQNFSIRSLATLYGKQIEIAIHNNSIYFINEHKAFSICFDDFISFTHKKGKCVFRLADLTIANTKAFAIKCDDDRLLQYLNTAMSNSPEEIQVKRSFLSTSTKNNKIFLAIFVSALVLCSIASLLYNMVVFWIFTIASFFFILIPSIVIFALRDQFKQEEFLSFLGKFKKYAVIFAIAAFIFANIIAYMPQNNEEFDPYMCHWCDGEGIYIIDDHTKICSNCNGTGKRQ